MTLYLAGKPGDGKEPSFVERKLVPEKEFLPFCSATAATGPRSSSSPAGESRRPELNYDDYAGIDVKDKFVLCFRGTPDDPERSSSVHDEHRARMTTARDKGALGIIYIYPETVSNPNGDWLEGFTPAMITEKIADLVFAETGDERRRS